MRVCMVVHRGQTASYGGAAIQCLSLCRELRKHNIDTTVLTSGTHEDDQVDVKWLCLNFSEKVRKAFYPIALFVYLIKNHKKYDILHVHGLYWVTSGAVLAAKIFRKPIIIKLSMYGEDDPLTIKKRGLTSKKLAVFIYMNLRLTDKVVSISRQLTQACRDSQISESKIVQIPNGVDLTRFEPLQGPDRLSNREELGIKGDAKVICLSGSISFRKGIDMLLHIWPRFFERYPDSILLLVGPIDKNIATRETFINYAKTIMDENIFRKSVILKGLLPQEKVIKCLQSSDIFVLPSRKEGLPNALLEAMACGLPSIATNIGGIRDIIDDGVNGLLFEKDNKEHLYDKIQLVMENDDLYRDLSKRGRDTVTEQYSIDKVANNYQKLYSQISV